MEFWINPLKHTSRKLRLILSLAYERHQETGGCGERSPQTHSTLTEGSGLRHIYHDQRLWRHGFLQNIAAVPSRQKSEESKQSHTEQNHIQYHLISSTWPPRIWSGTACD